MKQFAFGVDVGGTNIKIGLFETSGNLMETWEIETRTKNNGKYILNDISTSIAGKIDERNLRLSQIEGIGMGVPGPVKAGGTVVRCVNLGWGVINVEDVMSELTGLKVKVGNDANVAALGEIWQGGGKGYKSIVMVTLGTGVGGGVVIDEKVVHGFNGAGGEIGHFHVNDYEKEYCGCGNKGCLEQYASATGIVRMAKHFLSEQGETYSVLKGCVDIGAKDIFDAAKRGDSVALRVIDGASQLLGKTLANIACVVNPEAFVIGGGVASAGDILLNGIQKSYKNYSFHAAKDAVFSIAKLSNQAGIFGGVKLVL